MTTVNMPAKRHHQWLPSGGATAMDGADDENVEEAVHPACQKKSYSYFGSSKRKGALYEARMQCQGWWYKVVRSGQQAAGAAGGRWSGFEARSRRLSGRSCPMQKQRLEIGD